MNPVLGSKRASPKRNEVAMPTDRSMTAQDVANYFIDLVDTPSGDNITNLKLQKLLYYAQGFYIAMQGEPLFPESLLAWKHGPVVRRIYDEYRGYAWEPLPAPRGIDRSQYAPEVREILDTVQDQYGRYTAKTLEKMTHEESPWLETPTNKIISLELLHEFFSQITTAGRKRRSIPDHPVWPTNSFRFQKRRQLSKRMELHRERLRGIARRLEDCPSS